MTITTLPMYRAVQEWAWLRDYLLPAIEHDPVRQPQDVLNEIAGGHLRVHIINGDDARGVVVTSIGEADGGARVFWINFAAGTVEGGPRRRVKTMMNIVADFEAMAVNAGCAAVLAEGRDWRRVLADYGVTILDNGRFELRKAL